MPTALKRSPKRERLNVRVSEDADALIRDAAQVAGKSVSEFVTDSAVMAAQNVLADQRHFALSEDAWERFVDALDRPAKHKPELAKLLQSG